MSVLQSVCEKESVLIILESVCACLRMCVLDCVYDNITLSVSLFNSILTVFCAVSTSRKQRHPRQLPSSVLHLSLPRAARLGLQTAQLQER